MSCKKNTFLNYVISWLWWIHEVYEWEDCNIMMSPCVIVVVVVVWLMVEEKVAIFHESKCDDHDYMIKSSMIWMCKPCYLIVND